MERLQFISSRGSIDIMLSSPYKITSIEGLNSAELQRQQVQYPDTDGIDIAETLYGPRIITVNGFIVATSPLELRKLRTQMVSILNGKENGILRYTVDNQTYFSRCIPDELPAFGQPVQSIMPFIAYFNLYDFYWKSELKVARPIYKRKNMIRGTFRLPMKFTIRETIGILTNNGDVPVGAVLTIYGIAAATGVPAETGLEIINHTTGASIALDYDIVPGEVVTIDTESLTITSSMSGNVLHYLDEETELHKFKIIPGQNEIETVNKNVFNSISASIEFYNQYLGV